MNSNEINELEPYLCGDMLYGDDFSLEQIGEWHRDESQAYTNLFSDSRPGLEYDYYAINMHHGFSKLPEDIRFENVLGLGSATAEEFKPICSRIGSITVIDPSDKFVTSSIDGVPIQYKKPSIDGVIPLESNCIDLVTCFGTLHHIPNVSRVVSEIGRVLKIGGYALVREPVVNMGDWRKPRRGLTKRERGIPKQIMELAFERAGLKIVSARSCFFPIVPRISRFVSAKSTYNVDIMVSLDRFLSIVFQWNMSYDRRPVLHKISPSNMFWVVQRVS